MDLGGQTGGGDDAGGERVENSAAAGREAIFSLCPHHSLFFFLRSSLFLSYSFSLAFPPTCPILAWPPVSILRSRAARSRSSPSQSELAARQMKIYRSPCPVGGFNLICHGVVAETSEGRNSRWTLLLVKRAAFKHFYTTPTEVGERNVDTRPPKSPRTCH